MSTWLRYVIAFIVFCHGFVYLKIGSVLPGPIKGWNGHPLLLAGSVTGNSLLFLVRTLHVIAGIAIVACAVAIALQSTLWRPCAIIGGAVGLVAFASFWDGQTTLLFEEGVIGAAVSLVLLIVALILPRLFV